MAGFTFALPPSLGVGPVRELAMELAHVLHGAGFSTVVPAKSYAELERSLMAGDVDAAWGPPIVCARVEAAGGPVALRAVRYGATRYRAVLVCRAEDRLSLADLGATGRSVRAAWVDRWSMAGYLLPRHHLRARGVDLARAFDDQVMVGSYAGCLDQVLELEADLTASFANRRGLGYLEICGERAAELRTLAYTDESPNDGVVLSPALPPAARAELIAGLVGLLGRPSTLAVLGAALAIDGFDRPPAGTYAPLLALV